ncbi:Mth938-like domain-containing protein [Cognatilysobacter segetis]|uniref:Mth938-like domain-containing protein n=1 Tax=Cognatilysobacter segetis TaxID=2492394 RepID=UPI00105BEA6F|nr:Mth938-like domain-containing protein [Lysobacter segetis]
MQLTLENAEHRYVLRGANGSVAIVNDLRLTRSFVLSTDTLIEDWPVAAVDELTPERLQALLALSPDVVLIGSGERQAFAPAVTQAACLQAGVGFEVMSNEAAARTFAVLAGEGRRVAAGFILG